MKSLKSKIEENISSVSLQESLRINIDDDPYQYHPTTWKELRKIIEERFEELGPGIPEAPIDLNDIDVSEMITFSNSNKTGIFEDINFEYIDLSNWDVSNTEDMNHMFAWCKNLKSIDISNWNVSKVENVTDLFLGCENLISIGDLFNWDVSKIKYMGCMFSRCKKLESVGDLSDWKVSNVEDMKYMFYACNKLTSVGDLSNWDVLNVEEMTLMFGGSGITNIPDWYKE